MARKKCTKLDDLHVREVSLVKKGANGVQFDIIKSAEGQTPSEILKSLMTNPDTMDEVDKEVFKDMGEDKEAYGEYVDNFVDEFVETLKSDGVDPDEFVNEMVAERTGNVNEEDSEENDDEEEKDNEPEEQVKKSEEEIQEPEKVVENHEDSSLLGKIGEVVKSFFTKNPESKTEKVEKEDEEEMKIEQVADVLSKALEPISKTFETINQRLDVIEKGSKCQGGDCDSCSCKDSCTSPNKKMDMKKSDEGEEVKKSEADIIGEVVSKALEPITKSISEISGRVENVEKQANPSQKILGETETDVRKSEQGFWKSIQLNK